MLHVKRLTLFLYFLTLVWVLVPYKSYALITFQDAVFPELAVSGRALAMGNAFISKVDDSMAAMYNPAGLGTIRNTHLHLSNFYLEGNKDWLNVGTGGTFTTAVGNFAKSFDLEGVRQLLLTSPGKSTHSRFSVMPNFTTRYFTIGYLFSKQSRARIKLEPVDALFEFSDRRDHGPYAAINLSLFGGIIKLGATGVYVNRKEVISEQDRNTAVNLVPADYSSGSAFIGIGGIKLTLPWYMLPTFSATFHNALAQNFNADSGSAGAPTRIERLINLGFSLTPQIGQNSRMHFEINFKDISGSYPGVSGQRKTTAGMEIDIYRALFIRFGFGDGYGSFGLGIKSQRLELDLTSYAVDSTTSQFRGAEDRRFAISLSSGF